MFDHGRKETVHPLSLYLGGFQTIDKLTEIEFSKLTLLYGPNSAGKSSIYDALSLAAKLFNHPENTTPYDDWDVKKYGVDHIFHDRLWNSEIQKYWRQTGPANLPKSYSPKMTIGVKLKMGKENATCSLINTFHSVRPPSLKSDLDIICSRDFEYKVNDQSLFVISEFDSFIVNLAHPYFLENHQPLCEATRNHLLNHEIEYLSIKNNTLIYTHNSETSGITVDGLKRIDINGFTRSWDTATAKYEVRGTGDIIDILEHFINIYNQLIDGATPNIESPELVAASRTIPTEEEMTIYIPPVKAQYYETGMYSVDDKQPIQPPNLEDTSEQLFALANSFAKSLPNFEASNSLHDDTDFFQEVNHSLSNELFRDRAYQLHAHFSLNIPYVSYKEMVDSANGYDFAEYYLENHGCFVKILLKDLNGVTLNFHDVGSGIGYVLPVLLNLHLYHSNYIQQPELHLHPALQSAMADVMLNNKHSDSEEQVIVETHSEHFLLRLLKRIRQTESNTLLDESKKLSNCEIKVHYFDSQLDGTTEVKSIRISSKGEFMDRWPKGFFEERYEELFDE